MSYDDVIMNRLKQDGIYECVVEMFKAKQAEIKRLRAALLKIDELNDQLGDENSRRAAIHTIVCVALEEKE